VDCRRFWQFWVGTMCIGGVGGEWVIQGRSMRGNSVRDSVLRPDESAPL
jgi:hypothetical protein